MRRIQNQSHNTVHRISSRHQSRKPAQRWTHVAGLFEDLDYTNVSTFLASGNVVFDAGAEEDDLVIEIERHLRERLGYEVDTLMRSMEERI